MYLAITADLLEEALSVPYTTFYTLIVWISIHVCQTIDVVHQDKNLNVGFQQTFYFIGNTVYMYLPHYHEKCIDVQNSFKSFL